MPLAAVQSWIQGQLNGLPMPGGNTPALVAYITPPDPNTESEIPTVYVWPTTGKEARDPKNAGTMPRNTGPGTPSGFKTIEHSLDLWLTWFGADDDPDADNLFPGMVDAIMDRLRTSVPSPAIVADPWTGEETQVADTGESMTYRIDVRAVADQRFLRYDALITLPLLEVIQR